MKKTLKKMVQLYLKWLYLLLYLDYKFKTLVFMAWMKTGCNLKKLGQLFQV